MATRIDHRGAQIPEPTPSTIDLMAREGCNAHSEWCRANGADGLTTYEAMSEEHRDRWKSVAKAMYASLALSGGAAATLIVEPKARAVRKGGLDGGKSAT